MSSILSIILGALFFVAIFTVFNGLIMIIVGAAGHIFNILAYQYLSFWEIAGIVFIAGMFGVGAGSR